MRRRRRGKNNRNEEEEEEEEEENLRRREKNKIMEEGLIPLRRENNKIEGNIKTVEEEIQE